MVSEELTDALVPSPLVFAHCSSYEVFYFATGRLEEDYLVPQPKRVYDDANDAYIPGTCDFVFCSIFRLNYVRNRTVSLGISVSRKLSFIRWCIYLAKAKLLSESD